MFVQRVLGQHWPQKKIKMVCVCRKCYIRLSKSGFVPQIPTPTCNGLHKLRCQDLFKVKTAKSSQTSSLCGRDAMFNIYEHQN